MVPQLQRIVCVAERIHICMLPDPFIFHPVGIFTMDAIHRGDAYKCRNIRSYRINIMACPAMFRICFLLAGLHRESSAENNDEQAKYCVFHLNIF